MGITHRVVERVVDVLTTVTPVVSAGSSMCRCGGIDVYLVYASRWAVCDHCGGVHVELLPWVAGKRQFTRALMITLATWARVLTWKQVAALFHCSWSTVATAVEEAVSYGLTRRNLSEVTHIGIDEISRKRGHVYVTNVYDLNSRHLL